MVYDASYTAASEIRQPYTEIPLNQQNTYLSNVDGILEGNEIYLGEEDDYNEGGDNYHQTQHHIYSNQQQHQQQRYYFFYVLLQLLSRGRNIFAQQKSVYLRQGHSSLLRFLCFLGGLSMAISSILTVLNIMSFITNPSVYVLQLYQGFFGVITMIVEAKDWDCLDKLKPWMIEWFRFLTVPAGKGAFYLFVGSLGISLWLRNILAFTIGLYMALMGLICIGAHIGIQQTNGSFSEQKKNASSLTKLQQRYPHQYLGAILQSPVNSPCLNDEDEDNDDEDDDDDDNENDHTERFTRSPTNTHCYVYSDAHRDTTTTATELSHEPHIKTRPQPLLYNLKKNALKNQT